MKNLCKKTLLTLFVLQTFQIQIYAEENQHRRPPMHNFTDEQKTCLEAKIGKPGQGKRPSRETMEAAFSACGIEKPNKPANENFQE